MMNLRFKGNENDSRCLSRDRDDDGMHVFLNCPLV